MAEMALRLTQSPMQVSELLTRHVIERSVFLQAKGLCYGTHFFVGEVGVSELKRFSEPLALRIGHFGSGADVLDRFDQVSAWIGKLESSGQRCIGGVYDVLCPAVST